MKELSIPSKKRLILLERLLCDYPEKTITSPKIQDLLGYSAAVIRKDISGLGVNCGASNGYKVAELRQALESALKLSGDEHKCIIVGLTRLGQVLLDNPQLENSSFRIVAGFDSNVNRTEVLKSVFPLHPTTMLETIIKAEKITYAILTTEESEAQDMAQKLVACGIKGIVNYTPCVLTVPQGVQVQNVSLIMSLKALTALT